MSDAEQFLSHLPEPQSIPKLADLAPDSSSPPETQSDTTVNFPASPFRNDGEGDRRLHIIARYQAEEMALNSAPPDVLHPPSLPFPWLMADLMTEQEDELGHG